MNRPSIEAAERELAIGAAVKSEEVCKIISYARFLERAFRVYGEHQSDCCCPDLTPRCTCGYRELWDAIPGELEAVELTAKQVRAHGSIPPELAALNAGPSLLDDATVESMLRDAASIERSVERDLCCHIKALAADRKNLSAYINETRLHQVHAVADVCQENEGELKRQIARQAKVINGLHDVTIVLRKAIAENAGSETWAWNCMNQVRETLDSLAWEGVPQ